MIRALHGAATQKDFAMTGNRTDQLGFCVVGPGGIAGMHLRAMAPMGVCQNRWVVGPDEQEARRFAVEWGFARSTSKLAAALADRSVDVVLISSPSQQHASQARAALDARKHVIVEIPLALSLADARSLVDRAQSVDRRLLVCHSMRSFPGVRELRHRVSTGSLQVSQIAGLFAVPRRHNEHWIDGTRTWVDNLLWHHGCHMVDASLWILGVSGVTNVAALAGPVNSEFGMTMDIALSFRTQHQQLVTHVLTYNTGTELSELRIITDADFYVLRDGSLVTLPGMTVSPGHEWSDLSAQDCAMFHAVVNHEPSDFDAHTVLLAMQVLETAQQLGRSR
jgi:2-hydroxy-4-carboxymuconate semialdehyde hemiacetal dehydrogenase